MVSSSQSRSMGCFVLTTCRGQNNWQSRATPHLTSETSCASSRKQASGSTKSCFQLERIKWVRELVFLDSRLQDAERTRRTAVDHAGRGSLCRSNGTVRPRRVAVPERGQCGHLESVKKLRRTMLQRASVMYFRIYDLRSTFERGSGRAGSRTNG